VSGHHERWVVLDIGETLVDETRFWRMWAEELGISQLEFMSVFGALVARGEGYTQLPDYFSALDWADRREAVHARIGHLVATDLFPDALPALERLRGSGYRVAVIGNQPRRMGPELRAVGVEAEVMAMSEEMGVMKPDPDFFRITLALLSDPDPTAVAYVGDRIDNDVVPASAAGMRAVWLRRGPWGIVPREEPVEADLIVHSLAELAERIGEAWA
jgi:HAD superfamily hydrolase (TIGR01549 family)